MQVINRHSVSLIVTFILFCGISSAFGHGMSEAEKQSIIDGGNMAYLWLGATHMLTGYDHLLFIFGMVFFLASFIDVLKYVTGFTIGHTITLIIATYTGLQVNYFLIDAVIALSVVYIAFVNMGGFEKHFERRPPNLLIMVTVIGLIHGVGLSTRLQQLPLDHNNLLLQIISFNIGIEIGQIIALVVMLAIIRLFKGNSEKSMLNQLANTIVGVSGALLFLGQLHGYSHTVYPDEFGFSEDLHHHAHEKERPRGMPEFDLNDIFDDLPGPKDNAGGVTTK